MALPFGYASILTKDGDGAFTITQNGIVHPVEGKIKNGKTYNLEAVVTRLSDGLSTKLPFTLLGAPGAPITLGTATLDNLVASTGNLWTSTITGENPLADIYAISSDGTTITVTDGVASGTFTSEGTPQVALTQVYPGATNSPYTSPPQTIAVADAPAAPDMPTLTVTAGDSQNAIEWADGAANGSMITSRALYRSTTDGFTPPGSGTLINSFSAPGTFVDNTAVNGVTYYYRGIATNGIGPSDPSVQKSGTPSLAPAIKLFTNTANGMAIGTVADSSIYQGKINGLKLVAQDDFLTLPDMYTGAGGMTDYAANSGHVPHTPFGEGFFAYPGWRGPNNENPNPLGYQQMSVAASVLTMTARVPTSGELANLPTNQSQQGGSGPPKIITASIKTGPSFAVSGQGAFALVSKVKFAPGVLRGSWESAYILATTWPQYQEADMFEVKRDPDGTVKTQGNINGNLVDGVTTSTPATIYANRTMPTDRWVTILMRKDANGTDVAIYDDSVTEGTFGPALVYSNARIGRFKGAQDFRMDFAINTGWDSSTFNAADFPKVFQCDWWQVWTASSRDGQIWPTIGTVNTTSGASGNWAFTLPSIASLYGGDTPDLEEALVMFSGDDCPGYPQQASNVPMPQGFSVNWGTRAVTGSIPAGVAGRVRIKILGSYNSGGPCKGGIIEYNVAPILSSLFNNMNVPLSGTGSVSIPFTAFKSGNLNHTYTVTSDKSWAVVSYGAGNKSATVNYTAPSSTEVATITVTATNGAGQQTTVTRTLTATNAYDPVGDVNVIEFWDFNNNASVFSDAGTTPATPGSSSIAQANGQKGVANLAETTAAKPTYVMDSINTTRRAAKFTRASVQRLQVKNTTIAAVANGDDKAFTIVEGVRRGTPSQSITTSAFWNDVTAVGNQQMLRHFVGSGNTVGMIRLNQGASSNITVASASAAMASDVWYVVTRIFQGTNLIVRVNGVEVYNGTCDSAPLSLTAFSIGAHYNNASAAWDSSTAFGGEFDSVYLINAASLTASVTSVEQRVAAAVGVTLP